MSGYSRRIKAVAISFELMIQMARVGYETPGAIRCVSGVPNDAVYISSFTDFASQAGYLVFYHPEFDPIGDGDEIPCVWPVHHVIAEEEAKV